jgi:predicted MFS family arabinose efflux permease
MGASLGILGSIAPVVSASYVPLLLSRLMAGIGCGLISAVVLSVIGTSRNPDRTFSLYYLIAFGGSALLVPVGVWAISRFLVAGGYILLAVLLVFVYLAANSFPSVVRTEAKGRMHMSRSAIRTMPALWCLGLSLFYWIGFGGVWAFVERLGIRANLSHAEIGSVLSLGPLASIAGAICASILHTRLGRSPILLASIALAMMSIVMLGWVTSRHSFVAAVLALSYVWPLFLAYLGGTMAAIDPSGRIVAMSVTSQTLGMAIGPAAAGVAAGYFGYVGIAAMALICCTIALICLGLMVGSRR